MLPGAYHPCDIAITPPPTPPTRSWSPSTRRWLTTSPASSTISSARLWVLASRPERRQTQPGQRESPSGYRSPSRVATEPTCSMGPRSPKPVPLSTPTPSSSTAAHPSRSSTPCPFYVQRPASRSGPTRTPSTGCLSAGVDGRAALFRMAEPTLEPIHTPRSSCSGSTWA